MHGNSNIKLMDDSGLKV